MVRVVRVVQVVQVIRWSGGQVVKWSNGQVARVVRVVSLDDMLAENI